MVLRIYGNPFYMTKKFWYRADIAGLPDLYMTKCFRKSPKMRNKIERRQFTKALLSLFLFVYLFENPLYSENPSMYIAMSIDASALPQSYFLATSASSSYAVS